MFYDKQPKYVSNLPVIILAFTMGLFLIYQICVQSSDSKKLDAVIAERTKIIQDAQQYNQVTSSILKDVLALAESGNKNAIQIIASLKQAGLNFQSTTSKTETNSNTAPSSTPNTDIKTNADVMATDAINEQKAD